MQEAFVSLIRGVLFHTHLPVRRGDRLIREQLEIGVRAVGPGRRRRGEAEQQQNAHS
jgi:hypothetical protein